MTLYIVSVIAFYLILILYVLYAKHFATHQKHVSFGLIVVGLFPTINAIAAVIFTLELYVTYKIEESDELRKIERKEMLSFIDEARDSGYEYRAEDMYKR